jgi:hypothetical protein
VDIPSAEKFPIGSPLDPNRGKQPIQNKQNMANQESDFYRDLRSKMRAWLQTKDASTSRWAGYLIWAPDLFYLLYKLSTDEGVPTKEKAKLAGAIAYFISTWSFLKNSDQFS